MQELRFVAVSEDGSYAVLAVPGRSGRYILPIDERLRAVALGQTSRLAQYEIEVESPLRPKEIQARIRAGETAEEIADAAGIPVERVRWFEGPVLAERAYIADQAQSGSVRRAGDAAGPGPRLGDIVTERLSAAGTDPADGQWDSRKRGDGNWQVSLTFPSAGRLHVAEWVFDPRRRHVMPDDDNAARLSLPESELPAESVPQPGEATVTPIASRLGAAAGMGGGAVTGPGVSRFRPERSVIPDRSLGVDRSLVERPQPAERSAVPDRAAAGLADRTVTDQTGAPERPATPAPPRAGQQDRPPQGGRLTNPGYAEFPESAPYRAPAPASDEPTGHRESRGYEDPGSASSAYHTLTEPSAYREPVGFRAPAAEPPAYQDPEAAVYRPAHPEVRDPRPEPAARHDLAEPQQGPVTPPRTIVFEDPEPTYLDEQTELTSGGAPASPAPGHAEPVAHEPVAVQPAPEPAMAPAAPAAPQPAASAPASPASPAVEVAPASPAVEAAPTQPTVGAPEPAAAQAGPIVAASDTSSAAAPEAVPAPAPAGAAGPRATASAAAAGPVTKAEVATSTAPSAQSGRAPAADQTVPSATTPEPAAEPGAADSKPTAADSKPTAADSKPTAADSKPKAPEPKAEVPTPAEPTPAEETPVSRRPGAKKNTKGRRSSVPSWDEIMLGSTRQRD